MKVRALVLDVIPQAIEQADSGAKIIGYGFGPKYADIVCVIMPVKSGVNLGFYRGTELPDKEGLDGQEAPACEVEQRMWKLLR